RSPAKGSKDATKAAAPTADQQSAALEPPAPGNAPLGTNLHLAPAPGFLGAAETAALEAPPPANTDWFVVAPSPLSGLRIGAYGEVRFGAQQNQWQTGFTRAVNSSPTGTQTACWRALASSFDRQ